MTRHHISRRRVLHGTAAFGALSLTGVGKAMAQGTPRNIRLCLERWQQGHLCPRHEPQTGELTMVEKVPVPGAKKTSPVSLPMAMAPTSASSTRNCAASRIRCRLFHRPHQREAHASRRRRRWSIRWPTSTSIRLANTCSARPISAPRWQSTRSTRAISSKTRRPRSSTPSRRRIASSSTPATSMSMCRCSAPITSCNSSSTPAPAC